MPFSPINPKGKFKCPYCTKWIGVNRFTQHLYQRHIKIYRCFLKSKIIKFLRENNGGTSFNRILKYTNQNPSSLINILEEMIEEGKISFYSVEIGNKSPSKNPKGLYVIRGGNNDN